MVWYKLVLTIIMYTNLTKPNYLIPTSSQLHILAYQIP